MCNDIKVCVLLQYTQLSWFDYSWWRIWKVYQLIHRHNYENTKSMWSIEYSKYIKVKRNCAIIWRNDWQGCDVFWNDVEYIKDIIRDVVQTLI